MLADVPGILVDLGTAAGVLVALATASRTPPVRWLGRRLIGEPMTEWLARTVAEQVAPVDERLSAIEHEMHPNDGGSMRDQVDVTAEQVALLGLQVNEMRRNLETDG